MMVPLHYTDLLKAHKLFRSTEARWKYYDVYMRTRNSGSWLSSADLPVEEAMLLFGFIQSWDPNFKGDLEAFLGGYEKVLKSLRMFEHESIEDIELTEPRKKLITCIFNAFARCCRDQRYESTDASKMLQTIIPKLFVMWDSRIRVGLFGSDDRDAKRYVETFLPAMQKVAKFYLDSYIEDNEGDRQTASQDISSRANDQTLAKLLDEYNYVRFTLRKSVKVIRDVTL